MVYQWYPGHMSKAKREMQENLKIIDAIIEIVDARIPYSSKNPDIDRMAAGKARIIILNKSDLADRDLTAEWKKYYESRGFFVCIVNSLNKTGIREAVATVRTACAAKLERDRKRGIMNRPIRAMVAGIPNCGKSTFINALAGKSCTKTGNKPGVTKGQQWIRLNKDVELLDTPGILWPKFDDQKVGMRIAFIGSINDDIIVREELAYELIGTLIKDYPGAVNSRYGAAEDGTIRNDIESLSDVNAMIDAIAIARACLKKGGEPDRERAANLILEDFRSTRLGHFTLERP